MFSKSGILFSLPTSLLWFLRGEKKMGFRSSDIEQYRRVTGAGSFAQQVAATQDVWSTYPKLDLLYFTTGSPPSGPPLSGKRTTTQFSTCITKGDAFFIILFQPILHCDQSYLPKTWCSNSATTPVTPKDQPHTSLLPIPYLKAYSISTLSCSFSPSPCQFCL